MLCPFCHTKLEYRNRQLHTSYYCDAPHCVVNGDMTRYETNYQNYPTKLISRTFIIDNTYIQIDYINNRTVISRLEACFLFDSVEVPRALEVNLKNPYELLDKIRMLMIFS